MKLVFSSFTTIAVGPSGYMLWSNQSNTTPAAKTLIESSSVWLAFNAPTVDNYDDEAL